MFLKHWYQSLYGLVLNKTTTVTDVLGTERTGEGCGSTGKEYSFGYDGSTETTYPIPSMYNLRTSYSAKQCGVILGTGTTPVSFNDYKLSGDIISTFNYSAQVSKGADESGMYITAVYTITNTSSSPITIGEIGIMNNTTSTSTSASDGKYCILLERTVLETPVTIEAGGVGQVTYTIRMDYPTAE